MTLRNEFEHFIKQHLPAIQRLEFNVEEADDQRIILSAPLEANFNDKGTAFGGSQYVLALSAAWGFTYLNMVASGQKESQFVIAEAGIQYLGPVTNDKFYAMAARDKQPDSKPGNEITSFTSAAKNGKKSRITIFSNVYNEYPLSGKNPSPIPCSRLNATFCLTPELNAV